jgi:hypothetical protein
VTIPGRGDLSPPRRRRRPRRRLFATLIALVCAAAGYGGYHFASEGHAAAPQTLLPCPSVSPTASALPGIRPLVVRNGTLTSGLATRVAAQLRHRDIPVASVGNTLFRSHGVATVRFSADRLAGARLLATQVAGASMVQVMGTGVLELDIGPKFRALVPAAKAAAAAHRLLPTPSASASPCSSASTP